jgi:rhodanese-related sulfurtransferase/DNA-directed RNA polymerase subunit RPC12/RpoP
MKYNPIGDYKKAKSVPVLCLLFFIGISWAASGKNMVNAPDFFVCTPCGSECDKETYDKPGECTHCHMKLVPKSSVTFKSISPSSLCSVMAKKPGTILLDVRTPEEFNGTAQENFGRLKGAINIPIQELESRLDELKKNRNRDIIVYCSHSHRSPRASYLLTQNGFSRITNMEGGMSVWNDEVKKEECSKKLLVR